MRLDITFRMKALLFFGLFISVLLLFGLLFCNGTSRQAQNLEQEGDALYRKGEPDRAVVSWSRAAELVPQRAKLYEKISAHYLLKGQWPQAQGVIENGLTHLPSCANLYFNLGLSYYLSGDYSKAEKQFAKVASLNSYYPDVHYLLGLTYRKEGKPEEAKREFVRELNVNPTSRPAWKEIRGDR